MLVFFNVGVFGCGGGASEGWRCLYVHVGVLTGIGQLEFIDYFHSQKCPLFQVGNYLVNERTQDISDVVQGIIMNLCLT